MDIEAEDCCAQYRALPVICIKGMNGCAPAIIFIKIYVRQD